MSTSPHRRHTTSSCLKEAAALENGQPLDPTATVESRSSRLLAFLLLILTWVPKRISNLRAPQQESPYAADYARGYAKCQYDNLEDYPKGWARTAAFLASNDNFTNFRAFHYLNTRVLIKLQNELEHLETGLKHLDNSDSTSATEDAFDRLRGRTSELNEYSPQDEVLAKCQAKLHIYNDLILKYSQIKALGRTSRTNHLSMFNWIWAVKPVYGGEFEWIFHPEDFIPLVQPKSTVFDGLFRQKSTSIFGKFLESLLQGDREKKRTQHQSAHYFNADRLGLLGTIATVFSTVLMLTIPILLFLMTSMTRNCMAVVVLASVFIFSIIMSLQKKCEVHDVFIGTATYCAVLVTFLGNLVDACGATC